MSIEDTMNFHDAMKPLVYFNCFVGLGLYRLPTTSNAVYLFMKIHMVQSTIANWIIIYVGLSTIKIDEDFNDTSELARIMYNILYTTNSCIAVTASLSMFFRRKELMNCLRKMPTLDLNFQAIVGARNDYRRQFMHMIRSISLIILAMFSAAIANLMATSRNRQSPLIEFCISTTLHYPIIILLVLDLNFRTFVRYLEAKFRDLNDGLMALVANPLSSVPKKKLFVVSRDVVIPTGSNVIKNNGVAGSMKDRLHVLHEIRRAHLKICKLSRKINHAFGLQNLLSMAISFVMITGLLYTVYSAVTWEVLTRAKIPQVVSSFIWIGIYAFKIWSVNHTCSAISNESERTGLIIYQLLKPRVDKELQKEVQEFAVQMLQNPVRFNARGFFTLDYAFIQGAIGSITTYLVILVQMSQVQNSNSLEPLSDGRNVTAV